MTLRIVRVLQIGDIHYPDAQLARPRVDIKRDPFDISDEVAPLGARFQKITQVISAYKEGYFDAIAFMGDFTTGNIDIAVQVQGLKDCQAYIDINLVKPLLGKHSRSKALFVPGNHDVDRTKCPSPPGDRNGKFAEYEMALFTHGQTHTSVQKTSYIEVSKGEYGVSLFGINTCMGCGEFMSFPPDIKASLAGKLEALFSQADQLDAKAKISEYLDITEQVDAPLILHSDLNDLDNALSKGTELSPTYVPVVVGHHNLLPQYTTRIAPLTELMNSGQLREFLSTKNRAVVYLHGHIHSDPIEVLFNQSHPEGCVISICAPELSDGYNVVEFHFDEDGAPLGVVVLPVKQDEKGKIDKLPPRRISFRQGRHRLSRLTPLARDIFYNTFAKNTQLHFTELAKLHATESSEAVETAVLELEWLDLVQIANRHLSAKQWNLSSSI